ncbi:MAG: right-handed parallel beta-helix repeat-containing protein [Verrucomicrobiota bacterium]
MKTNFNQAGRWRVFLKSAAVVCLSGFPVMFVSDFPMLAGEPVVVELPAGVTGAEIQQALDGLPDSGGVVVLPPGSFEVSQPIELRRDHQTLRGSGPATVLRLADNANCPVIILGEPLNDPVQTIRHLKVAGFFVDGNRVNQQRERWRLRGEGSEIRNNGVTVQDVSDSTVENVTCARCRSGGLVTTRGVRRLTVRNLTAFDNEFDGLACYQTEDCLFTGLYLHDNPGAGISLDLDFSDNVVSNAVLTGNDLGVFMRASRGNQFCNVTIRNSRHFGVFMAHVEQQTPRGWEPVPRTGCAQNSFTNLAASDCGGAAFRVNDDTCTNNVVIRPKFDGNARGGLSQAQPDLVAVQ